MVMVMTMTMMMMTMTMMMMLMVMMMMMIMRSPSMLDPRGRSVSGFSSRPSLEERSP